MRVDPEARRVDTSIRASSERANAHLHASGRHDALSVSTSPEHHAWMAPAAPMAERANYGLPTVRNELLALGREERRRVNRQQGFARPNFLTQIVDRQALNAPGDGSRDHPVAGVIVI